MFLRVAIDQSITVHETDNLTRFHVENAGLDAEALDRAFRSRHLGHLTTIQCIDVRLEGLLDLIDGRDDSWEQRFADMLAYADSKGWMPDKQHVRAHVVGIPAITLDTDTATGGEGHAGSSMSTGPDVDFTDGQFYADRAGAHRVYAWMREHQPVFRDRNGLPAVATYEAILEVERNPELFSNAGGIRPEHPAAPYMIDMDDPAHLLRRKLVNAGFTRKRLSDRKEAIGQICDTLIDAICERGECDFVRDIAAPLPMAVIGDMLGVRPEDRAMLLKWSDDLVCGLSSHVGGEGFQRVTETFIAYTEFSRAEITNRRANPTNDLFTVLANAEVDGQRLSDDEIIMETLLILVAGDETTRHTITGGTEQALRHRDQWNRLVADPTLLPDAIEEMLRWTSPVKNMCRQLTADTTLLGEDLKEGEKIMLMFESANFDEDAFESPDSFRIDRKPNNHVAFGFGAHFCLGNQLARLELSMMLTRILERLPDLRLADETTLPLRAANFVSGLETMPVVFTPTPPVHA